MHLIHDRTGAHSGMDRFFLFPAHAALPLAAFGGTAHPACYRLVNTSLNELGAAGAKVVSTVSLGVNLP